MDLREDLRRGAHGAGPSDRNFGVVFTIAFLAIGLWPLKSGAPIRIPALLVSGLFPVLSLACPRILHFDLDRESPYMLRVADVKESRRRQMTAGEQQLFGIDKLSVPQSPIPAVTHVDCSARVETVHRETDPRYYELIEAFRKLTGCPVIVNTSFNVRGEPIVCTPEDAFYCFMGTGIEALAVGNCFLRKEDQDPGFKRDCKSAFELD